MKGDSEPFYFNYAWTPGTYKQPREFDWLLLSRNELSDADHIRCHNIEDTATIQHLYSSLDSGTRMKALILINNKAGYQLDPRLLPAQDQWTVPVLVVTSAVGETLNSFLDRERIIEVRVDLDSTRSLPLEESRTSSGNPVLCYFSNLQLGLHAQIVIVEFTYVSLHYKASPEL